MADELDALPVNRPAPAFPSSHSSVADLIGESLSYKENLANSLSRALYASRGATSVEDAYELTHRPGVELMRSRYCVRWELGLCPKKSPGTKPEPLFLVNNGRRLRLRFHCPTCEMTVEDC